MESKNIIIVLIVIILILAVMIGITVLHPFDTKQASKVKITSNKTLTEGDNLTVKLTDLNKTPISKEKVNIIIKDSKGKVVANKTVQTNDKGNAKLDLDLKKGKYDVSARYDGNKNYTGNNTTQKLTIKEEEKVVEATVEQSSSEPQYLSDTGEPISEADYRTLQVYGKSANSREEWEAQKASLGY